MSPYEQKIHVLKIVPFLHRALEASSKTLRSKRKPDKDTTHHYLEKISKKRLVSTLLEKQFPFGWLLGEKAKDAVHPLLIPQDEELVLQLSGGAQQYKQLGSRHKDIKTQFKTRERTLTLRSYILPTSKRTAHGNGRAL